MGRQITNFKRPRQAKNGADAWDLCETSDWLIMGQPHGYISLQSSSLSINIKCKCGAQGDYTGYFAHNLKCPKCGTIYYVNPYVEVIEIENPSHSIITLNHEEGDNWK